MMMMKCVYAFAALAIALLGTVATTDTAEAQRYRSQNAGQNAGMNWESGMFNPAIYPQSRSAYAQRSTRAERNARTPRSSRSARMARTSRNGGSSFATASLTGGGGVGPRPRAWCGWWMRTQLGGGPAYNLAWNWRNYGSPTTPRVGAVVVWRHHVGMITGQAGNGQWIVKSGNDGGRVRERARSVSGAIFRA
jgi:hypothetical protein